MTCVTITHDITSHPLSKSKIKKNKNENQNKIKQKRKKKNKENKYNFSSTRRNSLSKSAVIAIAENSSFTEIVLFNIEQLINKQYVTNFIQLVSPQQVD